MFERGDVRLPWSSMAHAWVYVWVPPTVLSIWTSWSSSILLFTFLFFKAEKKIPKHWTPFFTNTVPNLTAYCASGPGLWPPEQCHPLMKGGQAGWWVGERGEGWRRSAFPTLNITSHPPLAWSDLFLFLVMARWDAVRKGDTIWRRPYPTPLF